MVNELRRMNRQKVCPILSAKLNSQSKDEIPVIIRIKNKDNNKLNSLVLGMSGKIKHNLPLVGGVACSMSIDSIDKLSNDPEVEYISFDNKVFALLDIANSSIGSEIPHKNGLMGEGITVAIIDTGVSPHSDLIKPQNRIVGFKDFVNNRNNPYDDNGHGTHVAGIIGSNGYSSNGKYAGIAPKANILAVKALDENGSGDTSAVVSALQWIIDTKDDYNTKIVNISLGSPATSSYKSDPLVSAVDEAIKAGLTVVVAAGNSGPSSKTILSPGNSPSAITVGAVDDNKTPELDDDFIAPFSSRGPTKEGINKPDVVAPGVDIMSLSNSSLNGYVSLSGTSMATPMVAGASALLYNKNKDLSPAQVKSMLKNSCVDLKDNSANQGSGIINLRKLLEIKEDSVPSIESPSSSTSFFSENLIVFLLVILLLTRKF